MKKVVVYILLVVMAVTALSGCSGNFAETNNSEILNYESVSEGLVVVADDVTVTSTIEESVQKALDKNYDEADKEADTTVVMSGDKIVVDGDGIEVEANEITITAGGTYEFSGAYEGQIHVDLPEDSIKDVQLILNGLTLENEETSPIYIESADEVVITLKAGSENYISDMSNTVDDASDSLEKMNGAIYSKVDLAFNGDGQLTIVTQEKTGILGKDDVLIFGGTINIEAANNGIRGKDLLYVSGGQITVSAGSDGFDSDTVIYIDGGQVDIIESFEAMEALDIIINGGTVNLLALDDGFNIAGDVDYETSGESVLEGHYLMITGGSVNVNSGGDGLDSNGSLIITGGDVVVNGPEDGKNGYIDYNGYFTMTGGTLMAAGNSAMIQTQSESSPIHSVLVAFETTLSAGSVVTLTDVEGQEVMSYTAEKTIESVLFASASLKIDTSYTVTVNDDFYETVTLAETVTIIGTVSETSGRTKQR